MNFVSVVIACAVAVAALIAAVMRKERARLAFAEFARRLDLAYDPGSFRRGPSVTGSLHEFPIVLDSFTRGAGDSRRRYTRIIVHGRRLIPENLSLGPEGFLSSLQKALGARDYEIGDTAFDAAARISCDPIEALAVLSSDTRRRFERLLAEGVGVGNGNIVWETRGLAGDPNRLIALTEEMTALACALSLDDREIPARLLANVCHDDSPVVRRKSLEALLDRYARAAETTKAVRAALEDDERDTRVVAAEALPGDEGFETLSGVALSELASDGARARAISFISRRYDAVRSGPIVETALASRARPVRHAAVVAAGSLRLRSALPRLVAMAKAVEGDTAVAVAEALGAIGDAEGEGAALSLLASGDTRVRVAAARALERIGGRSAVEPLFALTGGILPFGELRSAATSAVRAIQSRLGPAERGGLSMAEILRADGALGFPVAGDGSLTTPDAAAPESAHADAPPPKSELKRGEKT
jgi:HEAT repeat protein